MLTIAVRSDFSRDGAVIDFSPKAGGGPPLPQFLVQSFAAVVDWSSSRALTEAQPDLTTRWRKRHQDPARGHNARLIETLAFLSFR